MTRQLLKVCIHRLHACMHRPAAGREAMIERGVECACAANICSIFLFFVCSTC